MKADSEFETRTTPHAALLLVCGKCGRKLDGGFGGKGQKSLARVLKKALRGSDHPRTRIVETECLSLCPKGAVTVVCSRNPGAMVAVPEGSPAELVLDRVLGPSGGRTADE